MKPTPLIYLIEDDEENRFQLWRAFQSLRPDCLLYCFVSASDLVEHLTEDFSRPSLLVVSLSSSQANRFLMEALQASGVRLTWPTLILTDEPYQGPPVNALYAKLTDYSSALSLVRRLSQSLLPGNVADPSLHTWRQTTHSKTW